MDGLKRIAVIILAWLVLSLAACKSASPVTLDEYADWKNTTANGTCAYGQSCYNNGFLYYAVGTDIYEYDLLDKKAVKMTEGESIESVKGLTADDDGVIYQQHWSPVLKKLQFDTKKSSVYMNMDDTCEQFVNWYREDETSIIYGLKDSVENELLKIDVLSNTVEVVADKVIAFYKDGDRIYYIAVDPSDENETLLYVKEKNEDATVIELGISPIMVTAEEDRLVVAEQGKWNLYEYSISSKELKPLDAENAYAVDIQLVGNRLFYVYWTDMNNWEACNLYQYDFETGENTLVIKDKIRSELSVFSRNSVFVNDSNGEPLLIELDDAGKATVTKLPTF